MIKTKRDSLEGFIREQIIGPGGCKGLYSLRVPKDQTNDDESIGEVVNTTPGSIYSSAILFPKKKEVFGLFTELETNPTTSEESPDTSAQNEEQENEIENINDISQAEDEDINSLSRRFPSSIGVSCCLSPDFTKNKDLSIVVSGSYYTKIEQSTSLVVSVNDSPSLQGFLDKNKELFSQWLILDEQGLSWKKSMPQKELTSFKESLRALNVKIASDIAVNPDGSKDPIFDDPSFKEQYRFLSSYKERLFYTLSNLKEKDKYIEESEKDSIIRRIEDIEKNETFFAYIEDLISICDYRQFGYWVAHPFEKKLCLDRIDFDKTKEGGKVIISPNIKGNENLKDIINVKLRDKIYLSLSVWLQLIKTSDNRTFLKVLLNNSSTEVETDAQRYYSIVSERVNERCFFNIKVDISSKDLCPYKNLQSVNLEDEEAKKLNFLYRNVEDYGVGHLCSVDWKRGDDGKIHVYTEFLPSVETPDIEPVPRDKAHEILGENGKYLPKPYLEDVQCLQFKWLSIFSDVSDKEIVKSLEEFIDFYKKWIDSQRIYGTTLENQEMVSSNLDACESDCQRMKSNISEFLTDSKKCKPSE
ncbi:MAG: hypothetical protein LIO79_06330 [Rikenellaceae bacterium]|nr:hypothetical protein [Rikenellaceae bacterium]MCC8174469.1 hypothetical protein [Odoribacter sp.]